MRSPLVPLNILLVAVLSLFSFPGYSQASTDAGLVIRVGVGIVSPSGTVGSRYNRGTMLEGGAGIRVGSITTVLQVSGMSKMNTPRVLFGTARFSGNLKASGVGLTALFSPRTSARVAASMLAGVGSYSVVASYSDAAHERQESLSQTSPGFKVGVGLSCRIWRLESFLEASYLMIRTDDPVNLLLVVLGLSFSSQFKPNAS